MKPIATFFCLISIGSRRRDGLPDFAFLQRVALQSRIA